jgi:hypothetical protein
MNRRNFLSTLVGAVAAAILPKSKIQTYTTPFIVPSAGIYTYRYVYRNIVTGCSSDASPVTPSHTFMMPEHDVIDIYRIQDSGEFEWVATK